jgi:hypothetical protein
MFDVWSCSEYSNKEDRRNNMFNMSKEKDEEVAMKKIFKHIIIEDFSEDGITTKFRITNKHDGYHLGTIEYYKTWKKYVFNPSNSSIFDESCLKDIIKFIQGVETK